MKSTDAGLLDISEAEASVGDIPHLIRVEVNSDGEGSDKAVYGAVSRRSSVAGIVCDRAEHLSTQSLYTVLWITPRGLLAAPRGAGGGARDGDPVLGAGRVPHQGQPGRGRDGEAVGVLTGGVADPTEAPLVPHTDGVLLV